MVGKSLTFVSKVQIYSQNSLFEVRILIPILILTSKSEFWQQSLNFEIIAENFANRFFNSLALILSRDTFIVKCYRSVLLSKWFPVLAGVTFASVVIVIVRVHHGGAQRRRRAGFRRRMHPQQKTAKGSERRKNCTIVLPCFSWFTRLRAHNHLALLCVQGKLEFLVKWRGWSSK